MAPIPGKNVVAARTAQQNLDPDAGGQRRDMARQQCCWVGLRLIEVCDELGKIVHDPVVDRHLVERNSEMLGEHPGEGQVGNDLVIVAKPFVAGCKAGHRPGAALSRNRNDSAGINASGKECSDFHIRQHLAFDRSFQVPPRARDDVRIAKRSGIGRRQAIEAAATFLTATVDRQPRARRELAHGCKHRSFAGRIKISQIGACCGLIDCSIEAGNGQQRLDLACERQPARRARDVQRLDPDPIADKRQGLVAAVPQREREDAIEAFQGIHGVARQQFEEYFGVAGAAEDCTPSRQFGPQYGSVIQFAIIANDKAAG